MDDAWSDTTPEASDAAMATTTMPLLGDTAVATTTMPLLGDAAVATTTMPLLGDNDAEKGEAMELTSNMAPALAAANAERRRVEAEEAQARQEMMEEAAATEDRATNQLGSGAESVQDADAGAEERRREAEEKAATASAIATEETSNRGANETAAAEECSASDKARTGAEPVPLSATDGFWKARVDDTQAQAQAVEAAVNAQMRQERQVEIAIQAVEVAKESEKGETETPPEDDGSRKDKRKKRRSGTSNTTAKKTKKSSTQKKKGKHQHKCGAIDYVKVEDAKSHKDERIVDQVCSNCQAKIQTLNVAFVCTEIWKSKRGPESATDGLCAKGHLCEKCHGKMIMNTGRSKRSRNKDKQG